MTTSMRLSHSKKCHKYITNIPHIYHKNTTKCDIVPQECDIVPQQDARKAMRVVFSVLTKRICMHKTNFLRTYSNIVLKVILNCMNMQIATQLIMMYNL